MIVKLEQEETWIFNMLNGVITTTQSELQRQMEARNAYIKLLENKYGANFDPKTGQLEKAK